MGCWVTQQRRLFGEPDFNTICLTLFIIPNYFMFWSEERGTMTS